MQIAEVVAQLSELEFKAIGPLEAHMGGDGKGTQVKVGVLIHTMDDSPRMFYDKRGLFQPTSGCLAIFVECLHPGNLNEIQECIKTFVGNKEVDNFRHPFGLQYADFDGHNMLFTMGESGDDAPRPSGATDWEYAQP